VMSGWRGGEIVRCRIPCKNFLRRLCRIVDSAVAPHPRPSHTPFPSHFGTDGARIVRSCSVSVAPHARGMRIETRSLRLTTFSNRRCRNCWCRYRQQQFAASHAFANAKYFVLATANVEVTPGMRIAADRDRRNIAAGHQIAAAQAPCFRERHVAADQQADAPPQTACQ